MNIGRVNMNIGEWKGGDVINLEEIRGVESNE